MIGMSIAIGSDHAGFDLKEAVRNYLEELGMTVKDFGTFSTDSVDYPDYAFAVAQAVSKGQVPRGILICATGLGMTIVANRISGIRAANCLTPYLAKMSRRDNDANILTMGGRILSPDQAKEIVKIWLETPFEGGRHLRRINKIRELTGG
ncbi:putative sugar phosphate isomerase YwlF [bacterium BMS3Abin05]|nr:putative sugar phosphate isomerase YwlF [bacterium BMS3Abin05]GBE28071.1 putative sugar phosphate isomerase YwlF [bacterium BMS3Bbin03]